MVRLQIPSHSRRITSLAVAGLAVIAAAAFSFGLEHQFRHPEGVAPFPAGQSAGLSAYADNIPEATPAREVEVATEPRVRRRAASSEVLDVPDLAAPSADAAPAVDASTTAPEPETAPTAPAPEPDNGEPPTQP